jgi:hypothetical protein
MDTETQTVPIRAKSTTVPFRRAGLVFAAVHTWVEHELACTSEGLKRLIALVEEPAVSVEVQGPDGEWRVPPLNELKAALTQVQADEQAAPEVKPFDFGQGAGSVSEMDLTDTSIRALGAGTLPTAGPTLERESEDTPPAKDAPQEQATQQQVEPEEDKGSPAPVGDPSTPAPDTPDAKVEGDAKAEPEA